MGQIHMSEEWAKRLLPLLARGASNRDIARELHLSETTVPAYLTHLYRYLGAKNRAHAVSIGNRDGLIKEDGAQ